MRMSVRTPGRPTIQIDPTFAYYLDRSPESVASELELAGFRTVRYFVTDETRVNGRLVAALRERGMDVWAMVIGNGTFTTENLPPDWPEWQMTLLKPVNDGFTRLSPFSHRYVTWKKAAAAHLVRTHPFTGFEVAEPYFPEWNGLASGVYGDVGPYARAAFKQFSGSDMPEFRYSSSPLYYKKDRGRYLLWIEFRVQAVNGFLNELINGAGGVREARPDIKIATWSLAVDAGQDPVGALREYQGMDAVEMIRTVRPDAHILQTHWPDWMRVHLPPDYIRHYRPFVESIRSVHPDIPLGIQTDIGSLARMRRSRKWIREFAKSAGELGYRFWTAYEYSIGLPMYREPPRVLRVHRPDRQLVVLEFCKRIDAESAADPSHYRCVAGGQPLELAIRVIQVDGNVVVLQADFPRVSFELFAEGIRDTPGLLLIPNERGNESPSGFPVRITGWY
ncbi:N-acyl-D-glucosamine 2-epimerase [Paenibacillus elgii]|uniref:N-acyl-D-glucosamine 2-epimerase n=2 Tax=Paenibacillus elgii TaxID=189691 RepID=A0A2T6G2Y3_9BACL|nr:N-acyl-D-glucosamine 2-epimerase [Paenibacillus elgii]